MCVCVCVNYSLMLNNVQTRDNFPCMILAYAINNLMLSYNLMVRTLDCWL